MRMFAQLRIVLSEDNDQLQRDLDINQVVDDTTSTLATDDGGVFTLGVSATNQQILFPKVTNGKYLMLIVWAGEVQYRVNNVASQLLSIKPNPATTPDPNLPYQKTAQPGLVFMGPIGVSAALTSLYLTNPSTTVPARVQVAIVGEAS